MDRHLNLIKTGHQETEKRVFPRFPFTYLIFRDDKSEKSFEIKDISYTGMQICLKDGESGFKDGDSISGEIHWYDKKVKVSAKVQRVLDGAIGLQFSGGRDTEVEMKNFLSIANIASSLRPIHEYKEQIELPTNLAFWLRSDGPFELFIWQHNDHEISKIQIIMMQNFVEWNDGKGLKSGKVLSVKNTDTPLTTEEEFEFLVDDVLDEEKLNFAKDLISNIDASYISKNSYELLCLKLGVK